MFVELDVMSKSESRITYPLIEELILLTNMYECVEWMRTVLPPV